MKTVAAILFAAIPAGALFLLLKPDKPQRPLDIALWYWHTPFEVPESELELLQAAGIDTLYVRAATIADKGGPVATLTQRWLSAPMGIKVHLVFRFDRSMVSVLERRATLADEIGTIVKAQYERAMARGIKVVGVQLDLDCPTRLLPNYARLAKRVKEAIDPLQLSLTALPTWYTSDGVRELAEAVDFLVPQFYENDLGTSIQRIRPISALSSIERTLRAADRVGKPFLAGLPAYGRALLYDEKGAMVGVQDDISARNALRHPSFEVRAIYPVDENGKPANNETFCGEEIIDLVATRAAPNGRGKGFHLVYLIPSPELIVRHMTELKQAADNCNGIVLFRYPEPGELSTVPLAALKQALQGTIAKPVIRIDVDSKRDPLTAIGGAPAETELAIYACNDGPGSTSVHPAAFVLTLKLDPPGLEEFVPQDVDGADTGTASLLRTTTLKLTRFHLAPGDRIKLATLRVRGPKTLAGTWSARLPGGFENPSGGMPPVQVLRD